MIVILHHHFIVNQPDLSSVTWVNREVSHVSDNGQLNENVCKAVRCVIKDFIMGTKIRGECFIKMS